MTAPILAIDFGTSASSAVLVVDGREQPVKDSVTGSYSWPSSVFLDGDRLLVGAAADQRKHSDPDRYRTGFKRSLGSNTPITLGNREFEVSELVSEVLSRLREEAQALAGRPIDRAVLTIPSGYAEFDPRRTEMIDAGHKAGFTDVDLLQEPVAAALAPVVGPPFGPGNTVLVYDLGGGTFDAALVRFGADGGYELLGHDTEENTGGRRIDALLVDYARQNADPELAAALDPPAGKTPATKLTALRAGLIIEDLVRDLKRHLSDQAEAEQYLTPMLPPLRLTREEFAKEIRPLLDSTVDCCHRLLAAAGVAAADLTGILQVGGSSRMPLVGELLSVFGRPARRPEDFDLAVVHGAAKWGGRAPSRRLEPWLIDAGHRPLRWALPGGQAAEMARWLVKPGEVYPAGTALAVTRLQDGSLWRLYDDATVPSLLHHVQSSPGDRIISGDWLATVRPPSPEFVLVHDAIVGEVTWNPDGTRLATAAANGRVRMWDPATGNEVDMAQDANTAVVAAGPTDRHLLLTTGDNSSYLLWDAGSGTELRLIDITGSVTAAAADSTASRMAVIDGVGNSVRVWRFDGATSDEPLVVQHEGPVTAAAFSPSGAELATASSDATARIWDAATGEQRHRLAHGSRVRAVEFSLDGTRLATGGDDRTVRVWDVNTGAELLRMSHDGYVYDVAFSPDGTRIATAGRDYTLRIWDATTGGELLRLTLSDEVRTVAFSPDGGRLATSTGDEAVQIWRISRS
jgi:actin-like ATPase involved in cell morphogenesis